MREKETVLVVDGGGRGSALVEGYARSEHVGKVIAVPGNDLMTVEPLKPTEIYPQVKTTDAGSILEICRSRGVTLVDVAQDDAVASGLVDVLTDEGVRVVGPTRDAGQIEWNKAWAREFGKRHGLPQPSFKICQTVEEGIRFIQSQKEGAWFVKASGLALGKGAKDAHNAEEAVARIRQLKAEFPQASQTYLIEEWLEGEEFSAYAVSDGLDFRLIGSAQDYKRAYNFDQGGNTGGMGASSPPLLLNGEILERIEKEIFAKVFEGLASEGRPYKGVLYLGGMLSARGELNVIEFNARWGDPEAQVILPGLLTDLFDIGIGVSQGEVGALNIETDGKARVAVAGVSKGYPGDYSVVIGKRVYGLEKARRMEGVKVFGAGVGRVEGKDYAAGGRLFYVVGEGKTATEAKEKSYQGMAITGVEGNNLHFRIDIAWRDVDRLQRST